MAAASHVIETTSLTKHYGQIVAVDGLSMSVPRGHVFGLLGPNGSGKTTTMSMLLSLVRPTAGNFNLFDSSEGLDSALHRVGAIIESPSFYPYLTGRQNLLYFQGISGRGTSDEIDELIDKVGLTGRGDHKFRTYSLGMKQRLGLAYALLGDPELLFLDEPTNGMDPAGMAEIRDLIRSLSTGGRTVLLSSHLLHEVEQVCDSVAILSKGKLITQGDVADLLRSQDQIRLETTDNDKAVEVLSALDWIVDVSLDDDEVVIGAASDRVPEISTAIGHSGVFVTGITTGQKSLESYFLEVTGDGSE